MDVSQNLKDAENALRDFISAVLRRKYGTAWEDECGVSKERVTAWRSRKETEEKRHGEAVDARLIYYADFYDLPVILRKNWGGEFSDALGNLKDVEWLLKELEKYRNSEAHRRELLPHQKHLILGISGEIRTRLTRYRSKSETSEDYYPRIEHVRDSLGSAWQYGINAYGTMVVAERNLRIGEAVDFVISASDPRGAALLYRIKTIHGSYDSGWTGLNTLSITFSESDIRAMCDVNVYVKSPREYHAFDQYDDIATFRYTVLPPQ